MAKLPFVLVGDHPENPTGLGRILGDLLRHLVRDFGDILDARVVGWVPWGGIPTTGVERVYDAEAARYPDHSQEIITVLTWGFNDTQKDWGASALIHAYRQWFGSRDGIVMTVWDPGRCHPYAVVPLPVTRWGYFAIDGENVNHTISGPAAEGIQKYDRVLAYTNYGAQVLETIPGVTALMDRVIKHLPHGIYCQKVFQPNRSRGDMGRAVDILRAQDGELVIGTVATNQPRKDWGLVAATLAMLRARGFNVRGWWHTDRIVSEAWSLPQLADDFGLRDHVSYTTSLRDDDLARCYAACVATIAPGRGEGFGYPLVESQACGTPVYHVDYAGGVEALESPEYAVPFLAQHLVGPYATQRPIVAPGDLVRRMIPTLGETTEAMVARRSQVRVHALNYDWSVVWPRWRTWIGRGLGKDL